MVVKNVSSTSKTKEVPKNKEDVVEGVCMRVWVVLLYYGSNIITGLANKGASVGFPQAFTIILVFLIYKI